MIILSATTDSISVTTSGGAAYDVDVVCTYADRVTSTGVVGAANRQLTNFASATTLDVVDSPASDTTRNVKNMNFRNAHATSAVDVLVQLDANGTLYELHKVTLVAGESLCYIEEVGFFVLKNATRFERTFYVVTDVLNNAAGPTFADVTGLTCPMLSGVIYSFLAHLYHISAAAATGFQSAVNIGAAPTALSVSTIDTVTASVTASAHSAGTATARDTAITAQTTGSAAITLGIISGYIIPSADGTFAIRFRPEITALLVTVKAGSWLRVWRPSNA